MGMPFDEGMVKQHYKRMKEEFEAGSGGSGDAPAAGAAVEAERAAP